MNQDNLVHTTTDNKVNSLTKFITTAHEVLTSPHLPKLFEDLGALTLLTEPWTYIFSYSLSLPRRIIPTIGSDRIPVGSYHVSIGISIIRQNPIGILLNPIV
jgi:hypothetical protein